MIGCYKYFIEVFHHNYYWSINTSLELVSTGYKASLCQNSRLSLPATFIDKICSLCYINGLNKKINFCYHINAC